MIKIVKTISTTIDSLSRRIVKVLRMGKNDIQTAFEGMPFGIDSVPISDLIAIHAETGEKGKTVVIGYINRNQIAEIGELRVYSTDSDGNEQNYIWLRNTGNIEIGGDADFMVRFSELENGFNQLRSDLNSFITTYNTHVHPGVTVGGGVTSPTVSVGSPSAADISGARIDEILTS